MDKNQVLHIDKNRIMKMIYLMSKIRYEGTLDILKYLDKKEIFTYLISQSNESISKEAMAIIKERDAGFTQKDITEIFDSACKLCHIKEATSLLIEFNEQFSDHDMSTDMIRAALDVMQHNQQASEVIITIINLYYNAKNEAHEIFDAICRKIGLEPTLQFLLKHKEKIRDCGSHKCYILSNYDIKKIFDQILLNGKIELIEMFIKHHIQQPRWIAENALCAMTQSNQKNAEKAIIIAINYLVGVAGVFKMIYEKKGAKYMLQFFCEYKKEIHYCSHEYPIRILIEHHKEAFKNCDMEAYRNVTIAVFACAAGLYQPNGSELLINGITCMSPELRLNGNDVTEIFSDVCEQNCIKYITNLAQFFLEHKNVITDCNINKDVICKHQDVVNRAFDQALLTQNRLVINMYIKFGIKSLEQLNFQPSDKKSYQQSIAKESSQDCQIIDIKSPEQPYAQLSDEESYQQFISKQSTISLSKQSTIKKFSQKLCNTCNIF